MRGLRSALGGAPRASTRRLNLECIALSHPHRRFAPDVDITGADIARLVVISVFLPAPLNPGVPAQRPWATPFNAIWLPRAPL